MDENEFQARMWVDLLSAESQARRATHDVTSRAEVYLRAGLPLDRVLDALKISRATWYRRTAALSDFHAENIAAASRIPTAHTTTTAPSEDQPPSRLG